MYLVLIGVLFLALKLTETPPVEAWSWWAVLSPFGAAVLWWAWADATGWTKRREIDKMDERVKLRREKNLEALGMSPKSKRRR